MKNNDYDLISSFYDFLSWIIFANRVQLSQLAFLNCIDPASSILFIGGGSGKALNEIFEIRPNAHVVYLEKSKQMLLKAQKKCIKSNQVEFILGDENQIPNQEFDIVICFYFLDLFSFKKQQLIFNQLNQSLKKDGKWLVADFNPAKKWWQKWIEKTMFLFLKTTTRIESSKIPKIKTLFKERAFSQIKEKHFFKGYLFSSVYRKL